MTAVKSINCKWIIFHVFIYIHIKLRWQFKFHKVFNFTTKIVLLQLYYEIRGWKRRKRVKCNATLNSYASTFSHNNYSQHYAEDEEKIINIKKSTLLPYCEAYILISLLLCFLLFFFTLLHFKFAAVTDGYSTRD